MARQLRTFAPHSVVHVVNRGNERRRLFDGPRQYDEFLAMLDRALQRTPTRLLAYAVMPNHWHLVLWPDAPRDLSQLLHYLTTLHAARFRYTSGTAGAGHVYQGRFRATSIDNDAHYMRTIRYVEANPVRAFFVRRAEDWPWTSLTERTGVARRIVSGPIPLPPMDVWTDMVNTLPANEEDRGHDATICR